MRWRSGWGHGSRCRSYLVSSEAALDATAIAAADVYWDSTTNAPEVLITFNDEGRRRFADVTRANIGRKIAIIANGAVTSVPVVQAAITGGETYITMGRGDPAVVEKAAEELASVLRAATALGGATVVWVRPVAARVGPGTVFAIRGLAGVLGGLILLAAAGLAAARLPITVAPTASRAAAGSRAWLRLAVTALAPLALLLRTRLPLPGIDLGQIPLAQKDVLATLNVFGLGVIPMVTGYLLVEIAALVVPQWRPLRHGDLAARGRLASAAVLVGVLCAAIQSFFIVTWIRSFPFDLLEPGVGPTLAVIVTLVAGSAAHVVLAGLVGRFGLGNGLAVVVVADLALRGLRTNGTEPPLGLSLGEPVAISGLVATVLLTIWISRRRVGDESGTLRLPSAGIVPLSLPCCRA